MTDFDPAQLPGDLGRLHALWDSKRQGRRMPARADFDLLELRPWMGRLHLVTIEGNDGRYAVFATASAERLGREMTGKLLSEYQPAQMAEQALAEHQGVLQHRRPSYREWNEVYGDKPLHWWRLALPLADDGETIDRYFVGVYFKG